MSEASRLVDQFGHRFSIGTVGRERADELARQLKQLGYRTRVSLSIRNFPRGTDEYKVAWWLAKGP